MLLTRITIATTHTEAMVEFYNAVFDANMQAFTALGTTLYRGNIAGIDVMFCPNEVVGIQAQKNRQQFRFAVSHIQSIAKRIRTWGGNLDEEVTVHDDGSMYLAGRDPDGNTIEFEQPSAARIT